MLILADPLEWRAGVLFPRRQLARCRVVIVSVFHYPEVKVLTRRGLLQDLGNQRLIECPRGR